MSTENENTPLEARQVAARINRALGVFLLFFGLIVLSAVFFTPGVAGKVTNAVCASILVGIGAGMILQARGSPGPRA